MPGYAWAVGAWLVRGAAEIDDLTQHQVRKPLVGAGGITSSFRGTLDAGATLLLASDGLLKYARPAEIARVAGGADLAAAARALVDLVRRPPQDDVAVVLVRCEAPA